MTREGGPNASERDVEMFGCRVGLFSKGKKKKRIRGTENIDMFKFILQCVPSSCFSDHKQTKQSEIKLQKGLKSNNLEKAFDNTESLQIAWQTK